MMRDDEAKTRIMMIGNGIREEARGIWMWDDVALRELRFLQWSVTVGSEMYIAALEAAVRAERKIRKIEDDLFRAVEDGMRQNFALEEWHWVTLDTMRFWPVTTQEATWEAAVAAAQVR
jgi:hypothetical protein